jgi:hypothetical protein
MPAKRRVVKGGGAGGIALIEIDELAMAVGCDDGSDICQVAALRGVDKLLEVSSWKCLENPVWVGHSCPTLLTLVLASVADLSV